MSTHKCKHCLKKTIEDAEVIAPPMVLPTSRCLAEGSTCHSWEAIAGAPQGNYSCTIHSGKSKINVQVATYEALVDCILETWTIFVFQKFSVYVDSAKDELELKPDLKLLSKDKDNCSKGFSKNITEQAVLKNINAVSRITEQAIQELSISEELECFPVIEDQLIGEGLMTKMANSVQFELKRRYKVFKPKSGSSRPETESTMREFISPVLIAAVELMIEHVVKSDDELKLKCEKRIIGFEYGGPVDYVILFNLFAILLTEAKHTDLATALLQNLLQQRAAQQFQAMALVTFEEHPSKRRRFEDESTFKQLLKLGSFGIVSNGAEWVFNKLFLNDPEDDRLMSKVHTSKKYCISLEDPTVDEIKAVLGRICHIINLRMRDVGKVEVYKRVKNSLAQVEANEELIAKNVESSQLDDTVEDVDM